MKKVLIVAALAAAVVAPLSAQDLSRLYTDPSAPAQDALDRLRLKTAWTATVPMDSRRDGFFSVQLLPYGTGHELLIQTRSGGVLSLDAATGQRRWYTVIGVPYRAASNPAGFNSETIFVINNIELFALDRATGRVKWQYQLPSGGAAPPLADEDQIYISLTNGRFNAYALPTPALVEHLARERRPRVESAARLEAARALRGSDIPAVGPLSGVTELYRNTAGGPQPMERYSFVPEEHIETVPLQAVNRVLLPGADGLIAGVTKSISKAAWRSIRANGQIRVPLGQYEDMAYIATTASDLYAVNITNGRLAWRFTSGGTPTAKPAAVEEDVYLPVSRSGLLRIDRATGFELWRNPDGSRFLAANTKFVYAADHDGRLVVIDRGRGTTLSTYDGTRDFVYPIQNDWTDRIYLAANNGLIVCLHDRDIEKPLVMRKVQQPAPLPPPGGGKPTTKEPTDADEGAVKKP
jgi:outer membrane protein assembly factor BamB